MAGVFHQLSAEEALQELKATRKGLTDAEVKARQLEFGKNTIPQPKSKTLAAIFLHQFANPLIYVLIGAAVISAATGDLKDAVFITVILLINAVLGTYQEWRAENSAQALRDMVKINCRVLRNGAIQKVEAEELVPGDIVYLESGNKVPADLRLLEASDLAVEEALLTGESVAVIKNAQALKGGPEISIGDRLNMVFAATTIQKGRGTGLVAATAATTQIGKIADSLRTTESVKPPLVVRMEAFSRKISIVVLGICVLLGFMGYSEGMPLREVFFLMVAVGVSAIPEGLPVALTVALSIATRRMAKRNVIVRKLPAVEGLGSCTLIASDKTGTLTMDQQSIRKIMLPDGKNLEVTGQGYNGEGQILENETPATLDESLNRFVLASVLCNESSLRRAGNGWEFSGDAVDVAFRALAFKSGHDTAYYKQQAEVVSIIPYESENKFSAVYFKKENQLHVAMKGAVEVIMKKLRVSETARISEVSEKMAAEGFRVMAIAGGPAQNTSLQDLPELELIGLVGMIDPLRAEAKAAVNECREAGIQVVMVTGDHPLTALAISRELGIAETEDEVISGAEILEMNSLNTMELAEKLRHKKVFARVAPLQKQRIVEAMKALGHFVAVTGDGANDAPALKSAHIGVAMGAGTDLAKEAASIIITDNNFASITAGVEEGRFTFDNLRKIIFLLISTGAAELLTVGLAIFLNTPLPFLAVQLLWLNLVTNGIQDVALAFEKGDKDVMKRPPRNPNESIFDRLMNTQIIISGITIAAIVFALWYHLINNLNYPETHARTVVMMLMVLLQNFHALNCRSETKSIFTLPLKHNYMLVGGILLAQMVHIAASYIPGLNTTLQLEPITFSEWLKLVPTAAIIVVVMEISKWFWRRSESRKLVVAS